MRSRRLCVLPLEDRITPTVGDLLHTLTPPTGAGHFGYAFAASSQYLVVGSEFDTVNSVNFAGGVHLFNPATGAFLRKIQNPTPESFDGFGDAVATNGDYVVVGAPFDNNSGGSHTGAAYIYSASTGNLIATLYDPNPDPTIYEQFGCAVGITSNGVVLVGAYLDDSVNPNQGAVYTFNAADGTPHGGGQLALPPSVNGDYFGFSIAVGGGRIAVGAPLDEDPAGSHFNYGGVHLYDEDTLAYQQSIFNPTPGSNNNFNNQDRFGESVALSGNNLVIGATRENVGTTLDAGSAFVYNATTGALVQTLTQPTPVTNNAFGNSVAVSADTVIVGVPYDSTQASSNGIAYVFDAPTGNKLATINNPQNFASSDFGWGVGAQGAYLYAGGYGTNGAYIFEGRATAPQANDDSFHLSKNAAATALDVLANDTAGDKSLLTVSAVTQPTHGSVSISADNKSVQYTPAANYSGPDSFTYTVADPNGSSTATVTITVDPPPSAGDDSFHVPENSSATTLDVLANDAAADKTVLTVSAVGQPSHGTVTISADNKSVQYTPAAYYNGPDSFTYTAADPNGSSTATVNITVDLVNNPPVAKDDEATVNVDSGANAIDVLANDSDPDYGQSVSISQVAQGKHGSVSITGGGTGLTYTPSAGYAGPDSFVYTVSDGNGGTATSTVIVSVQAAGGSPPLAVDDFTELMEDAGAQTIDVLANDSGDGLIITTATDGQHGKVTVAADGKSISYNPQPNFAGTDSFLYAIRDADGGTAYASVAVTVDNDVADRLEVVTSPGTLAFTEGDAPLTVDPDLRVSSNNNGITKAQVKIVSGYVKRRDVLVFTPALGLKGSFSAGTGTLTLTGPAIGLNPEAILRSVKFKNASVDPVAGVRTLAFTVSDALGTGDPAYRKIEVKSINTPPTLVLGGTASTFKENGKPVVVAKKAKITDPDNTRVAGATVAITANFVAGEDVLSVAAKPGIVSSFNAATGELTLTGNATLAAYNSMLMSVKYADSSHGPSTLPRTISFTVTDGITPSATVEQTVNVVAVNDAPVLNTLGNPSLPDVNRNNTNPTGVTVASLLGSAVSDPDPGALQGIAVTGFTWVGTGTWQFSLDNGATWQAVTVAAGKGLLLRATDMVRFLPSGNFTGVASLSYRAWDQTAGTAGQLAAVGVGGGTSAFSTDTEMATVKVT